MNLRDCFEEGWLKKDRTSKEKAEKSLENAEKYLQKARSNLKIGNYDVVVICSYTSMFHSSRAILFKDGIKERSHLCIVIYLRETYPQLRKLVNTVDFYRRRRHLVIYGLDTLTNEEEAKESIVNAREFLEKVKKMI